MDWYIILLIIWIASLVGICVYTIYYITEYVKGNYIPIEDVEKKMNEII